MRPLLLVAASLALLSGAARASGDPVGDIQTRMAELKRNKALTTAPKTAAAEAAADDAAKLAADARKAVAAYEKDAGAKVSFADGQNHASVDFYLRSGGAEFNPNRAQTGKLRAALRTRAGQGGLTQSDALLEALKAADGNLTLGAASLSEILAGPDRDFFIRAITDMTPNDGKNYYRFAGFYVGLHDWSTAALGELASQANIAFNPVVHAAGEIVVFWGDVFSGRRNNGVDSAATLTSRAHYGSKFSELQKGLDAAKAFRAR